MRILNRRGAKCLLNTTTTLLEQGQAHPEGGRGGGQRTRDQSITACRKGPVECSAQIGDLVGAIGQPVVGRIIFGASEEISVVIGVTASDILALFTFAKNLDRITTDRFEQLKPRFDAAHIREDQRLSY